MYIPATDFIRVVFSKLFFCLLLNLIFSVSCLVVISNAGPWIRPLSARGCVSVCINA